MLGYRDEDIEDLMHAGELQLDLRFSESLVGQTFFDKYSEIACNCLIYMVYCLIIKSIGRYP